MSANPIAATPAADAILQQIQARLGAAQSRDAQVFASHFLRRVTADDIAARPVDSWVGLILELLEFVRVRKPGAPSIRVFNPNSEQNGWESTRTAIFIATDDMRSALQSRRRMC
jgi:glutamate dehydrogenase